MKLLVLKLRGIVTMKPVVFCIMFAHSTLTAIRVQFVKKTVAASYDFTSDNNDNCTVNTTDPHYILGLTVTSEASQWLLYFQIISTALSLFSGTFLGSYSERGGGRKLPLLIPTAGYTFYMFLNFVFMYLKLPLQYFFITEIVAGLTGNTYTALAISFAYMADITSRANRTYRLVILEACIFIGGSISQLSTGYWIQSSGLMPPVWLGYALLVCCVLYIVIWVKDTSPTQSETSWSVKTQCLDVIHLFTRSSRYTCFQLSVLSVVAFLMFVEASINSIIMLYLLSTPFCFTSINIGYFQAVSYIFRAIGLLGAGKLISFCLKDLGMAITGFTSHFGYFVILIFATNKAMVFCAAVVGFLTSLPLPAIRGHMSKLFASDKQGVLFTLLGCIQGFGDCISPLIYNNVYSATLDTQANAVFIVCAVNTMFAIVLVSVLQVSRCMKPSQSVQLQRFDDKSEEEEY
ncbi:proton-coupled folate transporter-like [Saccoglossus kowalevskii]|uniref:Proton-coupled folate transporter-like n=1 Tax=Saccoglossus kowalevskii TaxID=10224 RepID=A0ABM0LTW5_SACKO|nr:PREDICTED: proton-coupled folate transporter-like [Saccoglossus kowalevskii]